MREALNGMLTLLLAKFMLNDVPHAFGISGARLPRAEEEELKMVLDEAVTELGGIKAVYQWFPKMGLTKQFYHLTTLRRVDNILKTGLSIPTTAEFSSSLRFGVYLFSHPGEAEVLYDYITYVMYKGGRPWEDLAVLTVSLPRTWLLSADPEFQEDVNPYAFISPNAIPANMVRLRSKEPFAPAKEWYEKTRPE